MLPRAVDRDLVAGIGMAHDAGGGVVPQHALEPPRRLRRAVGRRSPCRHAAKSPCRRRRHGAATPRSRRDAVLSSALSSGQSETASEPSRIASVSRLGEATEPESRWSRPMTIGAFSSPLATISLKARPRRWRSPRPTQQMRAGRPWKRDPLARHVEPVVQVRVVRDQLLHLGVGAVDVLRVARQRRPAERPDAAAEERADIGRHEAREVEGVRDALVLRHLADVVAVVERRHAGLLEVEHGLDMHRHRALAPPSRPPSGRSRAAPAIRRASSPPAGSR